MIDPPVVKLDKNTVVLKADFHKSEVDYESANYLRVKNTTDKLLFVSFVHESQRSEFNLPSYSLEFQPTEFLLNPKEEKYVRIVLSNPGKLLLTEISLKLVKMVVSQNTQEARKDLRLKSRKPKNEKESVAHYILCQIVPKKNREKDFRKSH